MNFIKPSICSAILVAMLSTSSFADCSYELFSISSAKDTKIIDFVDQLSDECGFSIIVSDPNAEKFLNTKLNKTNLKNLTINEVLDIVLKENNLSYTLENNLLKISYLSTKVFEIDYILSQRKSEGSTDVTLSSSSSAQGAMTSGSNNNSANEDQNSGAGDSQTGIKIESTDEVKFWEELDSEFQSILNRPHDVYKAQKPDINRNAGLVTVTATTKQLERFERYLKRLQDKVQLQVLIDVQLLSVTMQKGKTTGIDWQQLYALQNVNIQASYSDSKGGGTTTTDALAATVDGVSHAITIEAGGSLNQVIKFLQSQGNVNAISNPKVLTLNNQPALITAGTEYFYKIKSETTQQGTGGGVAATTQNDTVQSVFAGVLLTITPEIADDKTITLKINPSLSETTTDMSLSDNTGRSMPPDLLRRQLSSVVTVKDGNRIILGGLINTKTTNQSNKVPLLGDIPVINYFFKYEEKIKTTEELVVIIEPHIIHKSKKSISLKELGYEGIDDAIMNTHASQAEHMTNLGKINSPKVGLIAPKETESK